MCDIADGCVIPYCLSCGPVHTCLQHTYPVIVNNRLHKRDSTKSAELKKLMIFVLDAHVSPYSPIYIHVSPYSPTYIHVLYMCSFTFIHGKCC